MAAPRAMVGNAGDPAQVRRAERVTGNRRDRELAELKQVLSTSAGLRVLWRAYVHSGGKDSVFARDPMQMAALAGQREHALWLEDEIHQADPEAMIRMRLDAARLDRLEVEQAPAKDDTIDD